MSDSPSLASGVYRITLPAGQALNVSGTGTASDYSLTVALVRDGQTLDVCVWAAHERAGIVAFPHGGATGQLAEQTRKIRAAVEKHVTDE